MLQIRRSLTLRETLTSEMGKSAARPIVRAAALAVIANPFAGRYIEDLTELFEAGRALGELFAADLIRQLSQAPTSYGKAAVVGLDGEFEHGGACLHPMLGKPMRAALGGGKAVIPSNVKVAPAGTTIDVPLSHKDDSWAFDYFDTMTVAMPDAPKPDEILVVIAVADGGRLHPRCGTAPR
ncbi:MAG TPA: amino acid synthesis family protein [Xanthobacteraceae bacterium]|nr:amino acid synthesis family protein [Xanthobacteraceae bacterium]